MQTLPDGHGWDEARLFAGFIVEALVHYLPVFPSARCDLLQFDLAAAFECDVVLPFRKGNIAIYGLAQELGSMELLH